jgi:glycosyltransferase involved in cell wall biosynthesis
MKILSISPYLPSEKTGHAGAQYIFRNLIALSKDHTVRSIFFANNSELAYLEDFKKNNIDYDYIIMNRNQFSLQKLFFGLSVFLRSQKNNSPFMIEKYNQKKMKKLISATVSSFKPDIVHIEYNYMHHYVQSNSKVPFILTEHDITTKVKERLHNEVNSSSTLKNYKIWKSTEPNIIKKFDAFITLTEEDKDYIKDWNLPKCYVIPPQYHIPKINTIKSEQLTLCFVGSFNRQPNVMALEKLIEIFPLIREYHSNVVLKIAGKFLSNYLLNKINNIDGIKYLGFVEKIDEMIAECTLFVAPIQVGAGLKMKIPHSLSVGTPVITTAIGAEGIPIGEDEGLWVEDSDDNFINKCVDLLKRPEKLNNISEKCIKAIDNLFDSNRIKEKLEKVYSIVMSDNNSGS